MEKPANFLKNSVTSKAIVVGVLILLMLIPVSMVKSLIQERESASKKVEREISSKWGYQQTLAGPVICVPYTHKVTVNNTEQERQDIAYFLPDELNIESNMQPEIRYRSIYKVVVYQSEIKAKGTFKHPDFNKLGINNISSIDWENAFVILGISDLRGIRSNIAFNWDNAPKESMSGVNGSRLTESGITVKIPLATDEAEDKIYAFDFALTLNGSYGLFFIPVGKTTNVTMNSPWSTPSFDGAFLPDQRNIAANGFSANWSVFNYNRNFPQMWAGNAHKIQSSEFGVNLLFPVDHYQKSMRSAKYAIMFIALTFLVFFMIELLSRKRIHPLQYLLTSIGLILFYSLLLSLSEQMHFNLAYMISALAIIGLITAYSHSIFKEAKQTMLMGGFLATLYLFLFTVLQLEDFALLFGSVGLFIALATVMFVSRKVDWYPTLVIMSIGVQAIFAQDIVLDLQIEQKDGMHFIDGIELGQKLNMQMLWQSEAGILRIDSSSWALGSSWANAKDTSFLLQSAVQKKISNRPSFWLPLPSSLPVFERILNKPIEYDSASAKIIVKDSLKEPEILKDLHSVNLEARNNGEILEIKLGKAFVVEAFNSRPNYILRINGASIDSSMFQDLAKNSTMLSRIIPIQDAQSAQLTLVLRDNCESAELLKRDDGKTLQIVLRRKATAAKPAEPPPVAQNQKKRTIVIDPGHGGEWRKGGGGGDPGAVGHRGLKEKDITLAVGLKLKKKLEAKGFTVKMTRETDKPLDLQMRPKMASDWGGDLFISLHCNAVEGKERQQRAEGFKFYILRAGGSEEDKAIARRENQAIAMESGKKGKTEISPAEWIILDNQLALYAERSALLAGHLVEAYDGGPIKKMGTGAGQAGFMVLVGAYMPAVLAELGFITHPGDAEIMASEKGQNEMAERLTKAIANFFK
ncbi:MAG: cell envelope integrity protein CreD [Fibromonadaceae bacterium]|jgi:inner membrane protein|nr:cell envelope integrity protein CreD [Fibromonadaceae bacterium]